ncbi:MAG: hypothetical protein ACP5C3_01995 [Methanomicrobiales archaeon]
MKYDQKKVYFFIIILLFILSYLGLVFAAERPCPTCGGDGKVCAKCGAAADHGEGLKTCPDCNGTGVIYTPDSDTQNNGTGVNYVPPSTSGLDPGAALAGGMLVVFAGIVIVGGTIIVAGPPAAGFVTSMLGKMSLTKAIISLPVVGQLASRILYNPRVMHFVYQYGLDFDTYIQESIKLGSKVVDSVKYWTKQSMSLRHLPPSAADKVLLDTYKANSRYNINYDSRGMYNLDSTGKKQYF